jgi:exopolysaccharide production protein ExoZ
VTRAAESRPLPFLWRRLTRVAPLYWVLTLALTATALLWPAFLPNVHPALGHVLLSLAFIPHFDPRGLPFPLLSLGWTLDYEAIFYLIVAAALFAPRRHQAAWIMGALATLVVAGFTLDDPLYILGANPMLLQFAAGVGLARLAEMGVLPGRRGGVALIAAGLLAFALISGLHLFREIWRPFWWGAPAAAIVAGALAIDEAGATPRWPWALALGDASYALYLVHMPAQAVVKHTLGAANPWLFVPAALAASLAAGLACHLWIEAPLISWARAAPALWRKGVARRARTA